MILLVLVSCKNEKSEEPKDQATKLPETFNITFNLIVKKDDTFSLLYNEDKTLNFSGERLISSIVKGSDAPQDVIFKLPADVLPTNIRLDLGKNKEQDPIVVNSMKAKYFDKIFETKGNVVKNYFYFNDFQLAPDEKTSTVKAVVKDGSYFPMMWSNELITTEFEKLFK
jgi:hypothetical protein